MSATDLRLAILLPALLLGARGALAQQAATTAEALFRAGREASRRGDAALACEKYREAYRLEPTAGTLLNIAVCEAELGELSAAWRHYHEVIHSLSRDDQRVALAEQHLRALEPRLPRLTIARGTTAPDDLGIRLDDVELGMASLGVAMPVDPGAHRIEVRAPGRAARTYSLDIEERDRIVLEVEPGPELPAPAQPSSAPSEGHIRAAPPRPPRVAPAVTREPSTEMRDRVAYGLLGFGAASAVAGIAAGVLVLDRLDTVAEHCPGMRCDGDGLAARDSGHAFYVAMWAAFGLAAATSGLGIYLLSSEPQAEAPVRATLDMAPGRIGAKLMARY